MAALPRAVVAGGFTVEQYDACLRVTCAQLSVAVPICAGGILADAFYTSLRERHTSVDAMPTPVQRGPADLHSLLLKKGPVDLSELLATQPRSSSGSDAPRVSSLAPDAAAVARTSVPCVVVVLVLTGRLELWAVSYAADALFVSSAPLAIPLHTPCLPAAVSVRGCTDDSDLQPGVSQFGAGVRVVAVLPPPQAPSGGLLEGPSGSSGACTVEGWSVALRWDGAPSAPVPSADEAVRPDGRVAAAPGEVERGGLTALAPRAPHLPSVFDVLCAVGATLDEGDDGVGDAERAAAGRALRPEQPLLSSPDVATVRAAATPASGAPGPRFESLIPLRALGRADGTGSPQQQQQPLTELATRVLAVACCTSPARAAAAAAPATIALLCDASSRLRAAALAAGGEGSGAESPEVPLLLDGVVNVVASVGLSGRASSQDGSGAEAAMFAVVTEDAEPARSLPRPVACPSTVDGPAACASEVASAAGLPARSLAAGPASSAAAARTGALVPPPSVPVFVSAGLNMGRESGGASLLWGGSAGPDGAAGATQGKPRDSLFLISEAGRGVRSPPLAHPLLVACAPAAVGAAGPAAAESGAGAAPRFSLRLLRASLQGSSGRWALSEVRSASLAAAGGARPGALAHAAQAGLLIVAQSGEGGVALAAFDAWTLAACGCATVPLLLAAPSSQLPGGGGGGQRGGAALLGLGLGLGLGCLDAAAAADGERGAEAGAEEGAPVRLSLLCLRGEGTGCGRGSESAAPLRLVASLRLLAPRADRGGAALRATLEACVALHPPVGREALRPKAAPASDPPRAALLQAEPLLLRGPGGVPQAVGDLGARSRTAASPACPTFPPTLQGGVSAALLRAEALAAAASAQATASLALAELAAAAAAASASDIISRGGGDSSGAEGRDPYQWVAARAREALSAAEAAVALATGRRPA